jgi:hypothetical protein
LRLGLIVFGLAVVVFLVLVKCQPGVFRDLSPVL